MKMYEKDRNEAQNYFPDLEITSDGRFRCTDQTINCIVDVGMWNVRAMRRSPEDSVKVYAAEWDGENTIVRRVEVTPNTLFLEYLDAQVESAAREGINWRRVQTVARSLVKEYVKGNIQVEGDYLPTLKVSSWELTPRDRDDLAKRVEEGMPVESFADRGAYMSLVESC